MTRYIDEKDVYNLFPQSGIERLHIAQIDQLPRADVAEVKHARWIEESSLYVYCSNCKTMEYPREHNFKSKVCPNCGAKMGGGRE